MSRNAISANPEHYIFKIFLGACPRTPLEGLQTFFSPPRGSKIFFKIHFPPPKQKILDRTLMGPQNNTCRSACVQPQRSSGVSRVFSALINSFRTLHCVSYSRTFLHAENKTFMLLNNTEPLFIASIEKVVIELIQLRPAFPSYL